MSVFWRRVLKFLFTLPPFIAFEAAKSAERGMRWGAVCLLVLTITLPSRLVDAIDKRWRNKNKSAA